MWLNHAETLAGTGRADEAIRSLGADVAARRYGPQNTVELYTELLARLPMGRAAKPREIGDMTAFLASDRAGYTTGVIVTIDGGISAKH